MTGYPDDLVGFATIWRMRSTTTVPQYLYRSPLMSERDPAAVRIGAIVRDWRDERRYTRPALVRELRNRHIRVSVDYLTKLERGDRDFNTANLQLREGIREILEIPPSVWREKTGLFVPLAPGEVVPEDPQPKYRTDLPKQHFTEVALGRTVPVYAAGTGPAWDLDDALTVISIPDDTYPGKDLIGLRAMSDSMNPYLPRGATAIIVLDDGMVTPGDFCGIRMADDGVVIKRYVQELPMGELLLESLNPDPGEKQFFRAPIGSRVMGKVVRRIFED